MFSILIPTWNNLPFLQRCVESINTHSALRHQVIIHVNDGSDGTLEWLKQQGIEFTHTSENAGICRAVNLSSKLIRHNYVVYMNDDMYVLPRWDEILLREIQELGTDCFMLSSTLIEPIDTGNPCVIVKDFGRNTENFREEELLKNFSSLIKQDWSGSTWPPTVVHRKWWEHVGGYSEEFSPGMSSDNDFSMKMWQIGCRIFKGVSQSRVYHFISKSTGRIQRNNGRKQFLLKWGIKQSVFDKFYLRRGEEYKGELKPPAHSVAFIAEKLLGEIQKRFW